jgi:SAM-dependent methyltransferase
MKRYGHSLTEPATNRQEPPPQVPGLRREYPPEILDACCGGRMWWWDKAHPLAVYMDNREVPAGTCSNNRAWRCDPDIVGDFRAMPFEHESFQLVVFDPPHIVREKPSGNVATQYGALQRDCEQNDLHQGFAECWRVLAPGGTLVFKWAGSLGRVKPHFPATPIVGTRSTSGASVLGTHWFVFYKPIAEDDLREVAA